MDMNEGDPRELQLLPPTFSPSSSSFRVHKRGYDDPSSLDLQLSISLGPPHDAPFNVTTPSLDKGSVGALKSQSAELIRLAAIEKAYTERVRELTRREVELAQTEFARARHIWEKAREDLEKARSAKDRATRQADPSSSSSSSSSSCMEITCQSCRQRFRP
ncbi:hypothetical protein MLD38_032678 [Melastoma candidum]|uniref:Uncharacterized protein n=1 Tax=Melastoma candidum TaxID=119954 RepID=A0ACB9M4P4_9MYRT|nr:hypothetical protein MLD38_032678 [Melastoma candidum]